jgi:hypothetical protein
VLEVALGDDKTHGSDAVVEAVELRGEHEGP